MAKATVLPTLMDDLIPIHISRVDFDQSNDVTPPFADTPSDDADELNEPDHLTGIVTVGINDGRLPKAEVEALNIYLARHGGQYEGHPFFRIS